MTKRLPLYLLSALILWCCSVYTQSLRDRLIPVQDVSADQDITALQTNTIQRANIQATVLEGKVVFDETGLF